MAARKKPANADAKRPATKRQPKKPVGPNRNGQTPPHGVRELHELADLVDPPPPVPPAPPAPDPAAYQAGNSRQGYGRLASEIAEQPPEYFWEPWILRSTLTLVIGSPNAGKSSLGAFLCSFARRPAILPGEEESVGGALVKRLRNSQVDLDSCLILDDRRWLLPEDRDDLVEVLSAHHCDLLWLDPIDSYLSIANENDPTSVRLALESVASVAREVRCSIVGARHPGKDPTNTCPGSRQWAAVPRQLVELRYQEGPPERRWIRLRKDPHGQGRCCRTFTVQGPEKQPGRFILGEEVALEVTQTWGRGDEIDEWKIDDCEAWLKGYLAAAPVEAKALYAEGAKYGFGDRMVRMAARRLGLKSTRSGKGTSHKSTYPKIHSGTPERGLTHPPEGPDSESGGGCVSQASGVPESEEEVEDE